MRKPGSHSIVSSAQLVTDPHFADRIADVRARIRAACDRAGRTPADVTLVAVSKTHDARTVEVVYRAGVTDFGENRIQEATPKILELRERSVTPTWHLVGHLQRNKAGAAVRMFDLIHSVDSERLAREIASRTEDSVRVLLEVNVSGEATKHGVAPDEAAALAERLGAMHHVDLVGLMTVAPQVAEPGLARPFFRQLRELRDAIGLTHLSMGMTDDFEVAIEEGATIVRIGRAIFGARAT